MKDTLDVTHPVNLREAFIKAAIETYGLTDDRTKKMKAYFENPPNDNYFEYLQSSVRYLYYVMRGINTERAKELGKITETLDCAKIKEYDQKILLMRRSRYIRMENIWNEVLQRVTSKCYDDLESKTFKAINTITEQNNLVQGFKGNVDDENIKFYYIFDSIVREYFAACAEYGLDESQEMQKKIAKVKAYINSNFTLKDDSTSSDGIEYDEQLCQVEVSE